MKIDGLTAIVTGSTGGLGRTLTIALANAGCNCICHYRSNQQRAKDLVRDIQTLGRKAVAVRASFDGGENIKRFFVEIEQACKEAMMELPRILVNSAAIFRKQPLEDVAFEDAQKTMGLNLVAPIVISKHFAQMVDTGKIVNIVDVGGIRPWAKYSVYCASKAGLIGTTKSLAKELAPAITVNAIAPGIFGWPAEFNGADKERQLAFIPMERIGTKAEIAAALIFLLENDYIKGQILSVDGGRGI